MNHLYLCQGCEFLDDAIRFLGPVSPFRPSSPLPPSPPLPPAETVGEELLELEDKGYTADLSFETDPYGLYAGDLDMRLNPESYHVDEVDRASDGSLYAVSFTAGVKGIIVDEKH